MHATIDDGFTQLFTCVVLCQYENCCSTIAHKYILKLNCVIKM